MVGKKPHSNKGKFSAIASTVLWILGIGLLFVIPAGSKFIWIADFCLLLGFCPLLWIYPAGWPWLVFGILNTGMGVFMEIGYHIPEELFPPSALKLRSTMIATHPTLVWILTGVACTIFGAFRMIKNLILFIKRRVDKSRSAALAADVANADPDSQTPQA